MDGMAIRIQGDPDVIGEIARLIQTSAEAEFLRIEQDDLGGIGADFDLDTVATVIAIISPLFFDRGIVPELWGILHRHRGTKITIEAPTQTITVESTGELTPESLEAVLDDLV